MLRISEVDRHRAFGLLQEGIPINEVSLRMNVNKTTIFRLRQRLHETDTVISETALRTIESVLPHCDVRSASIHHTQSRYLDTGSTRLSTKSIMPDTRRISY
ncbi:hypothetical protein ElyMa_003058800 [Elysia marginata]|uniref:Resolvase HTH domain-containing protein n=1 Tax=Elysia marginata TaxID=1093978 RepID=A0AAV4IM26_9GAST|nr:hypothetical protein ElyMa_003058800 [Elysia marginata]